MVSLAQLLEPELPLGQQFTLSNIHTVPKLSKPLVQKPERPETVKIIHLITLFHNEVSVLAAEIYVYLTLDKTLKRTIYVSKVDTTGLSNIRVGRVIQKILHWIFGYPIKRYLKELRVKKHYETILKEHAPFKSPLQRSLHILIERAKGDKNYGIPRMIDSETYKVPDAFLVMNNNQIVTELVLFTRAEHEYLFPNSHKNSGKHMLDDGQLLKWWLKTINSAIKESFETSEQYVNVLNSEPREIARFFPGQDWKIGSIYSKQEHLDNLAVYNVPLLPDDPKGRFLEHLVVENRIKSVNLKQFWTELAIRQEFRLGRIVGLISVEGISKSPEIEDGDIVKRRDFETTRKILTETDYNDAEEVKTVLERLQDLELHFEKLTGKYYASTNSATNTDSLKRPVADLNMLVKRKKSTTKSVS
ncbi:hypothetical protein OGAPHI_003976 [Ogataea philodendri]|uniref:histone acetyltransferase n=1 Tax=Ogataea philodendri TaxID=1378263 RepID=A0A9P8P5B7_9ASCO|nr:uncharacterized protein OGAPHI_003976 [Ogataea philodendri]KAH3665788.1 hypothetical protein OGAPHI_003976 [Ogataea philodendri]